MTRSMMPTKISKGQCCSGPKSMRRNPIPAAASMTETVCPNPHVAPFVACLVHSPRMSTKLLTATKWSISKEWPIPIIKGSNMVSAAFIARNLKSLGNDFRIGRIGVEAKSVRKFWL